MLAYGLASAVTKPAQPPVPSEEHAQELRARADAPAAHAPKKRSLGATACQSA